MGNGQQDRSSWSELIIFSVVIVLILVGVCLYISTTLRRPESLSMVDRGSFPDLSTKELSPLRAKVVGILRQQFAKPQPGTYYSQGEKQSWCVNFVSWVAHEAGASLTNPHNGGWRISGVRSLEAYYRAAGRFHDRGDNYHLQPGDLIFYDKDSQRGEHVNFFLKYDKGKAVTIGGDEGDTIMVQRFDFGNDGPIKGFAALE